MKRLIILITILVFLPAFCSAQRTARAKSQKIIQLSEPKLSGPLSLEQALAKRRSVRRFANRPLDLSQICQLAWAGQGITQKQTGFRTAPSAGALYPIKLYLATQQGLYIYNPQDHTLEQIEPTDLRKKLSAAALGQDAVANAACNIIVAGAPRKLAPKYGNKAQRFTLLEAGHVSQNIQLQAVCLDLVSVPVGAFDIRELGRVCKMPAELEPLIIVCIGYPSEESTNQTSPNTSKSQPIDTKRTKKAVLITASRNFREEELFDTRQVLNEAGIETIVASSQRGPIKGVLGREAIAELLINNLNIDDYDAIIFIGGPGAREYFNSITAFNIAKQAVEKKKVLAAICIAPTILSNAGVLKGIRVTSYFSEQVRLQRAGAIHTGVPVEKDGLIITASGPLAARAFGKAIADALAP